MKVRFLHFACQAADSPLCPMSVTRWVLTLNDQWFLSKSNFFCLKRTFKFKVPIRRHKNQPKQNLTTTRFWEKTNRRHKFSFQLRSSTGTGRFRCWSLMALPSNCCSIKCLRRQIGPIFVHPHPIHDATLPRADNSTAQTEHKRNLSGVICM